MGNNILDIGYNDCTGCSACAIICPFNAVSIELSNQGFYTPVIHQSRCTHCGVCKEVCYKFLPDSEINSQNAYTDKKVVAVLNNYTEQLHSVSTAGVATKLSKSFYNSNFNVCGVTFTPTNNKCEHIIVQSDVDVFKMKGSKYIQSNCYSAFKNLISSKKKTIIFGLPCQIYGLNQVLKKKGIDELFLLVDLYCAGVPSLNLWKKYKDFISRTFGFREIVEVNFRNKTQGWHKFSMLLTDEIGTTYRQNLYNDMFFSFYLKKVCLNKSCYNCKLRHDLIVSDIRLGDFWGNKYQKFDDGVELVIISTKKGEDAWDNINDSFRYEFAEIDDVFLSQKYNRMAFPKDYADIVNELSGDEKLEVIHKKFNLNTRSY